MRDPRRLLARAERAFPNIPPNQVLNRVRAIVGSERAMPATAEGLLAVSALQHLKNGDIPNALELSALELMIRLTRPAPLVHKGRPDDLGTSEQAGIFPDWGTFQKAMVPLAHAIGRVDRAAPTLSKSETIGTGFVVAPALLLTNKHVVMQLSRGTGKLEPDQGVVRFQLEDDSFAADEPVSILRVAAIHDTLDAALLHIGAGLVGAGLTAGQRLPEIDTGPVPEDADVVVAGYPANDSSRNPIFIQNIFNDTFEVLRAAPGQLTSMEEKGFTHDCSTLGGNSGSPIFSMHTGKVIGLHRGGSFLWNNEAVDGKSIAEFIASVPKGAGMA